MESIIAGFIMGVSMAVMYLTFALVIAIICRVPFKIVAQFWKDYDD